MSSFTESVVEQAALAWFEALGYAIVGGPSLGPGEPGEERRGYADVGLVGRLRDALARLDPSVSREGLDEAFRKLTRISSPQPVDANRELHQYLVNGVSVEYLRADETIGYDPVRLVEFDAPENNDWLVVNQLTIVEGGPAHHRARAGRHREAERHHRLDRKRVGPRQVARRREAHLAQVRLSAEQAGCRDEHGLAAGGVAFGTMGEHVEPSGLLFGLCARRRPEDWR
jgi:hypothetical protein